VALYFTGAAKAEAAEISASPAGSIPIRPKRNAQRRNFSVIRTAATLTLVAAALALAPTIARAQAITVPLTVPPVTLPPPELPPLRLFQSAPPTPTGEWISLKSADFWKPPVSGSDVPLWTVSRTASLNGPRGLVFSAGVSGRRGDPMPLYLSQPALMQSLSGGLIKGPGMYRTQWDVTLEASAPVGTIGRVKVKAFGDLIIPVMSVDSANPAAPLLNSRAIRFGIVALF
jgi:hypothetical protein